MTTLPALSSVNDILDTDLILVEHSTGEGFKMTGADLKNLIKAQAVNTVASGNMHAVTSNAVFDLVGNHVILNFRFNIGSNVAAWQPIPNAPILPKAKAEYALIMGIKPSSGFIQTFYVNAQGILLNGSIQATAGDWYFNGAYLKLVE